MAKTQLSMSLLCVHIYYKVVPVIELHGSLDILLLVYCINIHMERHRCNKISGAVGFN